MVKHSNLLRLNRTSFSLLFWCGSWSLVDLWGTSRKLYLGSWNLYMMKETSLQLDPSNPLFVLQLDPNIGHHGSKSHK
ncbi:hypothetical protein AQUCO_00900681v1 [Aquilegia coerulea]|uniref:Uncharacterized protein n=1 Tax=Aquilegia coerulea TaxID=218851 RepID=A0A2G5EEY2_AQUCA|nr:hypothetical protein AQUCO_00900681v1 [Aquilegia coerulea]